MKIASIDNPVRADWFFDQGLRLDASPYLSGALEARKRLEALPNTVRLDQVTAGHNGGIFNGPKFSRVYLDDPEQSVPFLGSTDMLEADFSYLPRLSKPIANALEYLKVEPGTSLISCSGTIGRMAYARPDMAGFCTSQHVMKVQSDPAKIPSGYLYTFLRSRFGVPMIVSSAYGAIIQHIEPHHLVDLPVPRFDLALEQRIHNLVEQSAHLRAAFQAGLVGASENFFRSVGLPELIDYRWHSEEPDLGFTVSELTPLSLRAMNFTRRAVRLREALQSVPFRTLGDICAGGTLERGMRFTRVATEPGEGVPFMGQKQLFWIRPEERWIRAPKGFSLKVSNETILTAARGMPSENGLFGRSVLITGEWLKYSFTEDLLRVESGDPEVPGAYLYAFLRSPVAHRMFRSMLAGSGPQSIHSSLLHQMPVPTATASDRDSIADTVRQAYLDRDRADALEDEALSLLTAAIEGAEG
ncbi:methylation-associated defense system restriction endonuclease subunit S MAD5 [Geodermatophilus sp. SYSU D01176]